MIDFYGEYHAQVDPRGCVCLYPCLVDAFLHKCQGNAVMYVLPEGAVALYPEEIYLEMRAREKADADTAGSSFAARRSLRRAGCMSCPCSVSRDGIVLPERFRNAAGICPGSDVRIIGVEIGVEIWADDKFETEMQETQKQLAQLRELEFQYLTEQKQ